MAAARLKWRLALPSCTHHQARGFISSPVLCRFRIFSAKTSDLKLYFHLLKNSARSKSIDEGKKVHYILADKGYDMIAYYGNVLIDLYANCGLIKEAEAAYRKIHNPGDVTHSSMIRAYAQTGHLQQAQDLFFPLKDKGPCCYRDMIKSYCLHGCMEGAKYVFDRMPERNHQHWGSMVEGYAYIGDLDSALAIFAKMPFKCLRTAVSVIRVYVESGDLDSARALFDAVPRRDVEMWNEMILAYGQRGRVGDALEIFSLMDLNCVRPDQVSFIAMFNACSNASALAEGCQIVEEWLLFTHNLCHAAVLNSTINMYAKCGSLSHAEILFDQVPRRDVVLWTTMITAFSQFGDHRGALQIFHRMLQDGEAPPNDVTFVTILTTCCQAGDLSLAILFFKSMKIDYQVTPAADHYICLVDHLSRSGALESAEDLIINMPYEPEPVAWLSLLSACKTHNDLKRAHRAATRVIELDPENSAPYSLLVGLANKGRAFQMKNTAARL